MKNWIYILNAVILAVLSVITGEIVTFIMLGFVLISLQNIHRTLKEMLHANKEQQDN